VSINQFNLKSNSSTEIADGFIAVVFHCWLKETKALHLLMLYLPTEDNGLILFNLFCLFHKYIVVIGNFNLYSTILLPVTCRLLLQQLLLEWGLTS
jgi:hypothetical protein